MTETPTNDPDDYPHSPGVLVVPTEEDISTLRWIFQTAYGGIQQQYENPERAFPNDPELREVCERRGSLIQELQAQLRAVEGDGPDDSGNVKDFPPGFDTYAEGDSGEVILDAPAAIPETVTPEAARALARELQNVADHADPDVGDAVRLDR